MAAVVVHDLGGNAPFPVVINDPAYFTVEEKILAQLEESQATLEVIAANTEPA